MDKTVKQPAEEKLKKELDECKDKYLRALADYQNLEKRIQKVRIDEQKLASKNIIFKILPVMDALVELEKINKDEHVTAAINLFKKILDEEQVVKIDVLGRKFDPMVMECVEVLGDGKDEIVSEEVQAGYMIFDQILRVAKVKVGKKKEEKSNEQINN